MRSALREVPMTRIVIDTGLFVALFCRDDEFHKPAVRLIKEIKSLQLFTTEAVVTECEYLLDFNVHAQVDFLKFLAESSIEVVPCDKNDLIGIAGLMEKYRDLPMDYADATLVNLCEKLETRKIATLDDDFKVYRLHSKERFTNVFGKKWP